MTNDLVSSPGGAEVSAEADRTLAKRSVTGVFSYILLLAIFFLATSAFTAHRMAALVEIVGMLAICGARLAIAQSFSRGYRAHPARWAWSFRVATVTAGLAWGIGCAFWMHAMGHGPDMTIMLVSTAGIAAGATSSLGPSYRLGAAYLVGMLTPTIVALSLGGDGSRVTYGFAAILVMYLLFLLLELRRAHESFVLALRRTIVMRERAEALAERTRRLKTLLDTVGQGFLSVDLEGRIADERSAVCDAWLGPPRADEPVWSYFARTSPEAAVLLELGLMCLDAGQMPNDAVLAQMPQQLQAGARHLKIEYRPTFEGERVTRLLIILSDVSSDVERRRAEEEQRELLNICERISADRRGVTEFFADGERLIAALMTDGALDEAKALRWIHTLKGNASIFGLEGIARSCHELEENAQEARQPPSRAQLLELAARWERSTTRIKPLLSDSDGSLHVARKDYEALVTSLEENPASPVVLAAVKQWDLEPSELRLARIAEQARRLAERLGKDNVEVVVESNGVRLRHDTLRGFWSSLIHLVRNAVDHGLEAADERIASGKSPIGRLVVGTSLEQSELVVSLEDDGRGIDWDRVASAAMRKGVPHQTRDDLESALFVDGLSTCEVATETSGRGVGMAALRSEIQAAGGRLMLRSEPRRGTVWTARFPDY